MLGYYDHAPKFVRDYMGFNGKGAQSAAKDTVAFVERSFYNDEIIFEGDGAMKWKSNGAYLPEDCAYALAYIRHDDTTTPTQKRCILNASVEATNEHREAQEREFIKEYIERNKNRVLSAEERYEMEAAFGKGTTVVNVITGQKFEL